MTGRDPFRRPEGSLSDARKGTSTTIVDKPFYDNRIKIY